MEEAAEVGSNVRERGFASEVLQLVRVRGEVVELALAGGVLRVDPAACRSNRASTARRTRPGARSRPGAASPRRDSDGRGDRRCRRGAGGGRDRRRPASRIRQGDRTSARGPRSRRGHGRHDARSPSDAATARTSGPGSHNGYCLWTRRCSPISVPLSAVKSSNVSSRRPLRCRAPRIVRATQSTVRIDSHWRMRDVERRPKRASGRSEACPRRPASLKAGPRHGRRPRHDRWPSNSGIGVNGGCPSNRATTMNSGLRRGVDRMNLAARSPATREEWSAARCP